MFFEKLFLFSKKNPARTAAYLKCNDICVSHEDNGTSYLFTLMYCGYCWLENEKAIGRVIELLPIHQAFPENDGRFVLIYQMVNSYVLLSAITIIGVFKIHYESYGVVSNPLSSRASTYFLLIL